MSGRRGEHRFRLVLTNPGPAPVEIRGFSTSCSCTSVAPVPLSIPPGKSRHATVSINLNKTAHVDDGRDSWPMGVEIRPLIDHVPRERFPSWTLRCTIHRGLTANPTYIPLANGAPVVSGRKPAPWEIKLSSHEPLHSLKAWSEPAGLEIETTGIDSRSFELKVLADAPLQEGPVAWDVWVDAETPGGGHRRSLITTIEGRVVSPIEVRPAALSFGAVRIGETSEASARICSYDGRRFRVIEIDPGGDDIEVSSSESGPAEPDSSPKDFRVRLMAQQPGHSLRNVSFRVEDPSTDRSLTITLPLTFHGVTTSK